MSLASLPMYDLPCVRDATDAWWAGLARAFSDSGIAHVPSTLTRTPDPTSVWHACELLFSQTCGYPLTHTLSDTLRVVATPVYATQGCSGADYSSFIVVRAEEGADGLTQMRGRRVAINARHSHSGYNVLRHSLAPLAGGKPMFSQVVETGSHPASMKAVVEGRADLAATDCVTFALLRRHDPDLVERLRVLTTTAPAPGLPLVTRANAPDDFVARLREGLAAALANDDLAAVREDLFIEGIEVLPDDAYRRIDEMETAAEARGYPDIV